MVFVFVVGFFAFLFGSMAISVLAAALAAKVARTLGVWILLSLSACVSFQVAYASAANLVRCLWLVGEGDAPFWDRYWGVVSGEWHYGLMCGLLFGVVGWVWCLKRGGQFSREPSDTARPRRRPARADDGLREAFRTAVAKKLEEQNRGTQAGSESPT